MTRKLKLLYFGGDDNFGLCPSYIRSARQLGHDLQLFDFDKELAQNVRFGKIGRMVANYVDIHAWIHKTNRRFVIQAKNFQPDAIFVFTNYHITTGALLFLRSILPDTKFVLVWPDSLANIRNHVLTSAPLYDMVATLSSNSVLFFERLGFPKAHWVPLAGDPRIHGTAISESYDYDVSFVGGWRPERERAMELIAQNFPGKKIVIHGPDWKRFCKNKVLLPFFSGKPLFGQEMADCFSKSRISINVIDDTNYPAANMRFFEIPTAGGLELVSSCPEMEGIFQHKKHLLYFKSDSELVQHVEYILANPGEALQVRKNAQELIQSEHNYDLRLQSIISHLNLL